MEHRFLTLTAIFLITINLTILNAQTVATGMPYECGFENNADLSSWVLNPATPTATDKWVINTTEHFMGDRSLFISTDSIRCNYGSQPNVVVAYLRYKFPESTTAQKYDISFDWKGAGDSAQSKLYVMFCPESQLSASDSPFSLFNIVSTTYGILPNATLSACQQLGASCERYVCGSETWQNVMLSNEIGISPSRHSLTWALVFIWVNNNRDTTIHRSSIAVDNVQINSALIKKPTNVQVFPHCEDSTMLIKWESTASEFDIEYRKTGDATWHCKYGLMNGVERFERNGIECSYSDIRVLEGNYDVRIRGVVRAESEVMRTSWVYKMRTLIYCPENHCVNYVDLYSPNVTCTYGYYPGSYQGQDPYTNVGVIDFGPDAMESRHTIHVDPNETDPRTGNVLHTVPQGAMAAVRLGNWNSGYEAESITYDIMVDSVYQGILIVKYAVVLEDPSSHPQGPEFRMEILDSNGQLINTTCGQVHCSSSNAVGAGWNTYEYIPTGSSYGSTIAWKDWTTIGVNLMPYHGQNIKVRFTAMDCDLGAHFGYAYFTVDCVNAHIETNNSGNDSFITYYAPEGFKYYWYKDNNYADSVGESRELIVGAGQHSYTCRVSFIEEPDCWFEINTLSTLRFPVPEYTAVHTPYDCKNVIKFNNTSHVMTKYDGEETHTSEPCQAFDWRFKRFSDGQTILSSGRNPSLICPNDGDSIEVTLTCYIGEENDCDSTRIDTIVVPSILSDTTKFYYSTCPENPILFDGKWFNKDTTYTAIYPNAAGCDSTSILYLSVYPDVKDTYLHDTICAGQSLFINGVEYNTPLDDYLIILKTAHDCDSAIYLTLTIADCLSGKCGNNLELTWTYNPENKVLSISGNGALNSNYTYSTITSAEVEKLVLENGVTSIGENAFANYSNLREITMPKTVNSIGEKAFYECTGLRKILNYREQPCVAYSNTFDGIDKFLCTLYVPAIAIDMYKVATAWRDFYYIEVLDPMGIDDVQSSSNIQKILRDGHIFIIRGEKVYTLQGQEVK